ncbi:Mrpl35 [Phodopus roborovskii]|uniref:Mrpl35 protein n=1 Tax=Phodopus roborovskii TaxID=109678 RepID=A0AAV0A2S1_PHORO|nr:Mrpl35 [Phodopus roborovskii]
MAASVLGSAVRAAAGQYCIDVFPEKRTGAEGEGEGEGR